MNALKLLKLQHHSFQVLFARCRSAREPADEVSRFAVLSQNILAHHAIEERFLYPVAFAGSVKVLRHGAVETHLDIELRVADVLALDAGHESFGLNLAALEMSIVKHEGAEEAFLFPRLERALDERASEELGALMETLFRSLIADGATLRNPEPTRPAIRLRAAVPQRAPSPQPVGEGA